MKVYSISEASRLLGVHRVTLHRWIQEKRVPAPATQVIAGVRLRFWTEADIAKIRDYKARQYWGKGTRRSKRKTKK